jgi:hypothetical protein
LHTPDHASGLASFSWRQQNLPPRPSSLCAKPPRRRRARNMCGAAVLARATTEFGCGSFSLLLAGDRIFLRSSCGVLYSAHSAIFDRRLEHPNLPCVQQRRALAERNGIMHSCVFLLVFAVGGRNYNALSWTRSANVLRFSDILVVWCPNPRLNASISSTISFKITRL